MSLSIGCEDRRVVSGQDDTTDGAGAAGDGVGLGRRVLAHELRTPLSAISTVAELLLDPHAGALLTPEQHRQYLSDVQISALHALAVVDATLDAGPTKAQDEPLPGLAGALSLEPLDLGDVAAGVVSVMIPLGQNRGVAIRLDIDTTDCDGSESTHMAPTAVMALADARAVRQMLFNLLSNALRFTPKGGQIVVDLRYAPSSSAGFAVPQISVSDTGGGIGSPEQSREGIDDGGEVSASVTSGVTTHASGGSGLGFRIVRALADGIGASLSVESAAGFGTRAMVRFQRSG